MRYLKKAVLTVLATALFFSLLLCRADASTSSKAKRAYKKYVSKHRVANPYTYGMKNPDYKIVDVNGDKMPELLFINRDDFYVEVWTFRGGKMRCMFKEGIGKAASFAYKKSKHKIAVIHMFPTGYGMQVFKVNKKKLKKTKTYMEYGDFYRSGTTIYKIKNKKVKKKTFKRAWNKYTFTDSFWKLK